MKGFRRTGSALVLCLLVVISLSRASDESNDRVIRAAKAAAEAAAQAAEAQKAVNKAVEAANQAAAEAQKLGEWVQSERLAAERKKRVEQMPPPPAPPEVGLPASNPIDRFVMAKWPQDASPERCDDAAFLRRVYLDIVGFIPKADETEAFLGDTDPDKRSKKIDELLARDEDYAVHWTQFWEDALCSNGKHQGGVGTRSDFKPYILESFKADKPYDVFVMQLLDPEVIGYNGGYVKSETHLDSVQTAANVGQVFLGTRMKCASCHDHFLNYEWTQKRFTGFASFFAEKDLEIIRCEVKKGEFVQPSFIFENDENPEEPLATLPERLSKVTRLIVDPANPRFASAFVNRLWKRYNGLGLVEPVDDFREDTPPSHPELLHWLAYEFASHDYDIKHMIRLILNSQTYQQKFDPALADRYEAGKTLARLFRSPSARRLTCEQLMDSVAVALELESKRIAFDETSNGLTRALGRPETRNEVITTRSDDAAVIQALEMMNGPEMHEMIYDSPLVKKLSRAGECEEAAEEAFLHILNRYPSQEEREATLTFLGETPQPEDWGDMLWALVVSPRFQYVY